MSLNEQPSNAATTRTRPSSVRSTLVEKVSALAARTAAIDMFNRICRSGSAPVQDLRLAGLRAVHGLAPLRRAVMRAGLGEAAG